MRQPQLSPEIPRITAKCWCVKLGSSEDRKVSAVVDAAYVNSIWWFPPISYKVTPYVTKKRLENGWHAIRQHMTTLYMLYFVGISTSFQLIFIVTWGSKLFQVQSPSKATVERCPTFQWSITIQSKVATVRILPSWRRVTSVRSGQAHRWRLLVMMLLGFVDGLSQL